MRRFYRSTWTDGAVTRGLASIDAWAGGWKLNWHASLSAVAATEIRAFRPDGSTVAFAAQATTPVTWLAQGGSRDALSELLDGSGQRSGWSLKAFADDSTETYDAAGKLQTITARNGWVTTLGYDTAGQLSSVRNPFGRQLTFTYDGAARLASLTAPGGEITQYAYDAADNLSAITWPDGNLRRYHYEDARHPHALTGVTDELGVRIGSYAYDAQARVTETVKAGGVDRITLAYPAADQSVVTDYSSGSATSRSYTFANQGGVLRPSAVSAPCPLCGNTAQASEYDALGNITKTIAHDGSVTFYAYDAKGRETEHATFPSSYNAATTRPALANASSVTSTQWHATWNLPTRVAEPGKVTAYAYDGNGNLVGQSEVPTLDASGAQGPAATPAGSLAPGELVDVVFVNDAVTVVDGVRTEDRNLLVESISIGGGAALASTAAGVVLDRGRGQAAFDGVDTRAGQVGVWWNGALRYSVPAAHIGAGNTLTVKARATLAGGVGAQMVVRARGVELGSVEVRNSDWAHYSFTIPGAHAASATATGWAYGADHLPSAVVQSRGGTPSQSWTLAYDAMGNLATVTDVTGGNLVGRATSYDGNGRLLTGTTTLGLPVTYGYTARGFVNSRSVNGQASTFTQNGVGLTTEVRLPDGQTVGLEYDATHQLTNVRLNGALVTAKTTHDGTTENTQLAILREQLQNIIEALLQPAHAQAFALPGGPGSVAPGMGLPGQPTASPAAILMGDERPGMGAGPLPPFDAVARANRSIAERLTKMCQCDPQGGYDRPTLRPTGYVHILLSGHLGPMWANKSYFTEPVNQVLVDEVVSRASARKPGSSTYFVQDIGRVVGYERQKDPATGSTYFAETRSVTLIVEPEHCSGGFRSRNEVVTMYPGAPSGQ